MIWILALTVSSPSARFGNKLFFAAVAHEMLDVRFTASFLSEKVELGFASSKVSFRARYMQLRR